jgi:S-phase kinase-associated protein 1
MSVTTPNMMPVTIITCDDVKRVIPHNILMASNTIKIMFDVSNYHEILNLPNIKVREFDKIIQYITYNYYVNNGVTENSETDHKKWNEQFVTMPKEELFELILAANFLDITSLVELTCATVCDMLKNKTSELIRQEFNIKNDLNQDDVEKIKHEYAWAYQ